MGQLSSEAVWSKRIRSFESSGLSQREWCERNGVSAGSLWYWRRRLASAAPALVPIVVAGQSERVTSDGALEIEVGGIRFRVSAGVDPAWLCAVLRGLR